ncbi:MAG: hypothetical protein NZM43_07165 [Saprospiraceae bacterium]|nr:hypothetical protein [Saprospiraceae bacterium]MDW8484088.1 hypothetical protein [Saprospiraceae bacterium]
MRKLRLNDFERYIPSSTWEGAEQLLRAQAVRRLQELERHFWVATVVDGDHQVEAEVIITPSKVKAFACECWEEGRRLMCSHIAAALVKIRQYLAQKALEREAQARAQEEARARRLNVGNILARADIGDLVAFVRKYAERDANFALALKAHFANVLSDTEDLFQAVLTSAFPPDSHDRALRPAEMRRARLALDMLMARADQPLNTFRISMTVLKHLASRAALAAPPQRSEWLAYCRQALHRLTDLEQLTPEQHEQAYRLLADLFVLAPFPEELLPDTLLFLARSATDENNYLYLRRHFDQAAYPIPTPVLLSYGAALAERGQYDILRRILEVHLDEAERILAVLHTLARLGYHSAILPAGMVFLEKASLPGRQQIVLENLLVEAAQRSENQFYLAALLRQRFCRQGDEQTLEQLRRVSGAHWPAEREQLLTQLYAQEAWEKAATLLAQEGEIDALARLLRECANLDMLQQYEDLFLPCRPDFVREMYADLLGRYLTDHFGKQPVEYARQYVAALAQKGQRMLAIQIAQTLIDQFPERTSLAEGLAEAFPKSQRPVFIIPDPSE